MATKAPPAIAAPPSHSSQYPPIQGGVQMMYPNQSTQPGVPYVFIPESGKRNKHMGDQFMYLPQPMRSPIINQPQQIYNPQIVTEVPQPTPYTYTQKYTILHLRIGIVFLTIGFVTCMIDPLIPIIIKFPYSVFPAGVFMIISGATSLAGSIRTRRCMLVVSMIFDILATISFFGGSVAGIIMSLSFNEKHKGFGIFLAIYCSILFVVVICDSSIKCCDTCCCVRRLKKPKNPVYLYVVQPPLVTVPS